MSNRHDLFCEHIESSLKDEGWEDYDSNADYADVLVKRGKKYLLIEVKILKDTSFSHLDRGVGQLLRYLGMLEIPLDDVFAYLVYFDENEERIDIGSDQYSEVFSKFLLPIDIVSLSKFEEEIT